ncbi:DUF6573 family protein [Streptacidiphilus sp. EB129]|uniref:DUF6573 family protein n=1 Tax=Streptacidiphilus sp. EB129 TaxID=3156262 RepID=UPI0035186AB1
MNDRTTPQQPAATREAWETGPDAAVWGAEEQPEENTVCLGDLFGSVIDVYSRAQALADGVLVEATPSLCREAGLTVPVALTAAAWADCVAWTEEDDERQGTVQDQTGRLWDVLFMTRYAISPARGGIRTTVELHRVPRDGRSHTARPVELVAQIGPGDEREPVLTIMQPHES